MTEIRRETAEMLRRPRRIPVSEAAERFVRISDPGGYNGPWDSSVTPYMVEPMNELKSRSKKAVIFCGPSRSGKTQALIDGWLAHSIRMDPGDMGLYFATEALSMDFRKRRIERMHRHSPEIRKALSARRHDNALRKVIYKNGMILDLSYPTTGEVAQKTLRYVAASDFDSFPDDINGEGNPFDLILTRTTTAMSAGMGLFESSPKRMILKQDWAKKNPHDAPPVDGGILALYNRSDRRRWYWQCFEGCGGWFEAPHLPEYEDFSDPDDAAATAHVRCPHCSHKYWQDQKAALNRTPQGKWHPEHAVRSRDNEISAPTSRTKFSGFWLLGTAAAFVTWYELVKDYLVAQAHFEATGDDTSLIAKINTQQGMPYLPPSLGQARQVDELLTRREEIQKFLVPPGVRCLVGTCDVQSNRFEIAVWGITDEREFWLVDRYALRTLDDGMPIRPESYPEHWQILTEKLVNGTYQLPDGRLMRITVSAVDSGGGGGSTQNAYAYWRSVRDMGLAGRLWLVKGEGTRPSQPIVRMTWPDGGKAKNTRIGNGDVPLLTVNTNRSKATAMALLDRDSPGPGYIHFPAWTPQAILEELLAEVNENGKFKKLPGRRNETFDLLSYFLAVWTHIGGDRIQWSNPPAWALLDERNPNILELEGKEKIRKQTARRRVMGAQYRGLTSQ